MRQLVLSRQTSTLAFMLLFAFNVQASVGSIGGVLEQSGSVAQIQRNKENIQRTDD